jgi:hypothetical protein
MWLQQRTLMSNVVAALTPSPWDVWVEVKSCIALHLEVCLYFYEARSLLLCDLNLMLNQTMI